MKVVWHHRVQAEDGQAVHIRSLASAFEGPGHAVEEVALVEKTGRADPAKGEATAHDGDERRALPCSLEVLTDGEDCLLFPPGMAQRRPAPWAASPPMGPSARPRGPPRGPPSRSVT